MRGRGHVNQTRGKSSFFNTVNGRNSKELNFDVQSYQFGDLDLREAASQLPQRDRDILVLYLMGHTQRAIAELYTASRSMVSKRLAVISDSLEHQLR